MNVERDDIDTILREEGLDLERVFDRTDDFEIRIGGKNALEKRANRFRIIDDEDFGFSDAERPELDSFRPPGRPS